MTSYLYTRDKLEKAVAESDSVMGVIRWFNKKQTGSLHNHISRLIKVHELDTSHFTYRKAHAEHTDMRKKSSVEVLIVLDNELAPRAKSKYLTRALKEEGVPYKCAKCSLTEWQGEPITLDVDHIDGNPLDCRKENLRFLCPNCHRQTPTFGSKPRMQDPTKICACGGPKKSRSKRCYMCVAQTSKINTTLCQVCSIEISKGSSYCAEHYHASTKGVSHPEQHKITWPAEQDLLDMVRASNNYSKLAKELGVSDNAIRKKVRSFGYDSKTLIKLTA